MSLLILQLMSLPIVPRAEDEDLFCYLLSSATAAEMGRLEVIGIQAVCACSQLDCQQTLYILKPLKKLKTEYFKITRL
jgi:hypothetical protein